MLLNVNNITKAPAVFSFQSHHKTVFDTPQVVDCFKVGSDAVSLMWSVMNMQSTSMIYMQPLRTTEEWTYLLVFR